MLSSCLRMVAAFVLVCSFAGSALAEGFGLYEYSARGIALGGAMVARKPDASAVAYNPALMTRLPGIHVMGGVSAVTPIGKIDTVDANGNRGTTSLRESTWAIPHVYYTHQINDKFTFGVGGFTRYGLGLEYPHEWPGRFNIYEVALQSFSLNPNIAWAATDKLSLAVGVELVYVTLDMKKRAEAPVYNPVTGAVMGGMEVDSNIQDASDTGIGFNLAGHYQFNDQWAVGALYRSQVRVHAKGDVGFSLVDHTPGVPSQVVDGNFQKMFNNGKADSTVVLPDSLAGGVSYSPIPELSIELTATWTRWSTFRDLNIHLPEPLPTSKTPKHWRDTWRLGIGIEYSPLEWLALRAGYVFDESPMPAGKYQDYLVPTNDRDIWSAGVGFKWDSWTVDLAYAFIDAKTRIYHAGDASGVVASRTHESNATHIASISIGYEF